MSPPTPSALPWSVPSGGSGRPSDEQAPPAQALVGLGLREHVETLWRIVARLGVPAHQIEDVLQETFITAARRCADIERGRERAFLIGTATRLSANYRKRAHVRREVSSGESLDDFASREPDAEALLLRKQLREQLDAALATLPDEQRAVFVLYELEGFSVPEIAELLALPLGTAASRLGRARSRFSDAVARAELRRPAREEP